MNVQYLNIQCKYKLLILSEELRFQPNYDHGRIFRETYEHELGTYLKAAAKHQHGLSSTEAKN